MLERKQRDWYLEQLIVIEGDLGEVRQRGGEGGGEGGGEVGRKGGEGVVREVQGEEGGERGPRWERGDAVMGEVEEREASELGNLDRDLLEEVRAQVELGEAREAGEGG